MLEQEPGSAAIKLPNGKLPLHEFCGKDLSCFFWFDAPEIVHDLIEDHRSALWTPGIGGYLPVYIVLCCNWEYDDSDDDAVDVLQVLIEAYPEGLAHASDAGELPLHTALSRLMQPPRKVIDILLDHHSHAIKQKNHNGCLPLHLAAACDLRLEDETIKLLVDRYFDAVLERNGSGSLPLHLLCANDKATAGMLDTSTLVKSLHERSLGI